MEEQRESESTKANLPAERRGRAGRLALRTLRGLLVFVTLAIGGMTFMHAWSATHYAPTTARTTRAAELTAWSRLSVIATGATIRRQINKRTPADVGLTFETRYFPGAHGLRLEAWRIAASHTGAPAVLMFPGYGASKDCLLPAASEFARRGFEIWMTDPHGIGGSGGSTTSLGWYEAEDVAAAWREFGKMRRGPVMLYGISMGAVSILRAVHHGWVKPDALILECPFDRFTHAIGAGYERFALPSWLFGTAAATWIGVQQGFNPFAHNPAEYIRSVRCPTLLLQGELDDTIGRAHVRTVGSRLNGDSTFALLPGAGHAFLINRASSAWREKVNTFLEARFPIPTRI